MPEILRDMMKPLLSLQHLSCQAIAIRFCWNRQFFKLFCINGSSYYKIFKNVELEQRISQLGLPKMLETDVYKIGISLIAERIEIHRIIEHLDDQFDLLDSSVVSLSPTGGINYEETIKNILQQPQVDIARRSLLAKHFCMVDSLVSDNAESHDGMMPHEILSNIPDMNIWELKSVWKILSQPDKEHVSSNFDQIVRTLYFRDTPILNFLLDNLFLDKIRNFWKLYGSADLVVKFCFDTQCRRFLEHLASPFYYPDPNSTDLVKELLALPDATISHVLRAMIERIVFEYDNVLYHYLLKIWSVQSEMFKQTFCQEQGKNLTCILHDRGYKNLEYASEILLLLQPFNSNLTANTSPMFIGRYLITCLYLNGPFMPPDNYLKKMLVSEDEIDALKRKVISSPEVRANIFRNMERPSFSAIIRNMVRWALGTEEESEKYINDLYSSFGGHITLPYFLTM